MVTMPFDQWNASPEFTVSYLELKRTKTDVFLVLQGIISRIKIRLDAERPSVRYRDTGTLFCHKTGAPANES